MENEFSVIKIKMYPLEHVVVMQCMFKMSKSGKSECRIKKLAVTDQILLYL